VKNTPNTDPNEKSKLGYNVQFFSGIVVGYEFQQDQLSNGYSWRYKVRIIGDNSDVDQNDDKDLSYADVLLSTDAGSGASYKLRSVRISQGDTVYGIKGPNLPALIIGVEPRKRSTVLHTQGKFKTLSGFYGSLKDTNILSGEFNEQLGPATPGGKPYTRTKAERETATDKLNEIGINPETETGVVESVTDKISPPTTNVTETWTPNSGQGLTRQKIFDIQEQTRLGNIPAETYLSAVEQGQVQGLVQDETAKKLKKEAYEILNNEPNNDMGTFTEDGSYIPPGFEDATTIDKILPENEGTFRNGVYIPPGFEDATTIDQY
tara:strand:- start:982 stop:1944 length:963 start_codon:yes stop_codon:yes gene_type:complete